LTIQDGDILHVAVVRADGASLREQLEKTGGPA
jgi:hypothetical protein